MPATTAFHSGNVYTVSPTQKLRAEAFIVHNGVFTVVGSNAEILARAQRDGVPVVDLQSSFVMPGIHDAHAHLLWAGLSRLSSVSIGPDVTTSNLAERLKSGECACQCPGVFGDWLVGDLHELHGFDREVLDQAFPDRPVAIRAAVGHEMLLNTAALKASGYALDQEDQQGHKYFRRPDGTLTGEVGENAMEKAVFGMPKPSAEHIKAALKEAVQTLHACGVTSVQEASSNSATLRALGELDKTGELKIDVQTHIACRPLWTAKEPVEVIQQTIEKAETFRSRHIDTNFIKFILDGVPMLPLSTHCGLTAAGEIDESKLLVPDFADLIAPLDRRGMTCKVHCTGQGSTRRALDVFTALRRDNPTGPRHEIAHCSGVHDDEYVRFAPLNVTAEMSPSMLFATEEHAAPDGLAKWDFGKMIANGAHITIGSDFVGQDPGVFGPCVAALKSVRNSIRDKEAAVEALMRMITLSGAEATGREGVSGSIEVGKKANFVLVDKDLGKGGFDGAEVLETWFEGERVYQKPGFAGAAVVAGPESSVSLDSRSDRRVSSLA